jgi:hypothetical protein
MNGDEYKIAGIVDVFVLKHASSIYLAFEFSSRFATQEVR